MKRVSIFRKNFAVLFALAVPAGTCFANGSETAEMPSAAADAGTRNVFSLVDDNDFFGWWSDKYYTNHTRLAFTLGSEKSSDASDFYTPYFFSFGQEIYTPKDRAARVPDPRDHPYAGFLYASAGCARYDEKSFAAAEIQLGVTGEWAIGKEIQRGYHEIIGEMKPEGWDTQIHKRVVGQILTENRFRVMLDGACGNEDFGSDLILRGFTNLGNLRGNVSGGGQFRFGWNLPKDFGFSHMRQSVSAALDPQVGASVYAFADLQADAIFWDKTLTGNNDRGADIYAYPLAAQATLGICAIYDRFMLSFFQTVRTKDFSSQDRDFFIYGGFRFSVFF